MKHQLMALVCLVCLFSCKHSKYNSEAIKLNDSAISIQMNQGLPFEKKSLNDAIILLNKATDIDSNYFIAYINKFSLQTQLHHYKGAIVTGNKLLKIGSIEGPLTVILGENCERTGDTVTAKKYYKESLLYFSKVLDTLNVNDKSYNNFMHQKALVLILLHQPKEANSLLTTLYNNDVQGWNKEEYKRDMNITATRDSLIRGSKIDTRTSGNKRTTSNATTITKQIDMASKANLHH